MVGKVLSTSLFGEFGGLGPTCFRAGPAAPRLRHTLSAIQESDMPSHDVAAPPIPTRKPREDEIDAYGVTHPGKVRKENQDHFLLCSLRKQLVVRLSSIPEAEGLTTESD